MLTFLSKHKLLLLLSCMLLIGGVILLIVSNSIEQKEQEKKALQLVTAQQDATTNLRNTVDNLAIISSSLGTHIKLSDSLPEEEELQTYLIELLREIDYTDSVFVSFVDTNFNFIYAFNKSEIDPAHLKGTSVTQFRKGKDLENLKRIMQNESFLLFDPFNLVEGWAGIPINYGIKKNGVPIGFIAVIVDISEILDPLYNSRSNEFVYQFRTSKKHDFDRQQVHDGTTIHNKKTDEEYYKNFDVDTADFAFTDFSIHDLDLSLGVSFKHPENNFSWTNLMSLCWYTSLVIMSIVIVRQIREQNKLNLVLKNAKEEIEHKNKEVIDSIEYAKKIQQALLKSEEHNSTNLPEHFIYFNPKDIVSGDFYWALEKENHLYLAAADCTGHGVPGAFLTMLGTSFLNEINAHDQLLSPGEILDELRTRIIRELSQTGAYGETKDGMDISLLKINLQTFSAEWAGANNPVYILNNENIVEVKGDKQPIGYHEVMGSFTNHKIQLTKGDHVFLFTDGYADQFGGLKGKKLKYKAFKALLQKNLMSLWKCKNYS